MSIPSYRKGVALHEAAEHKRAAVQLRSTKKYVPGYKDSAARYEKCREQATKRVTVMSFVNKSGKPHFGAIGEMLSGQVLAKALRANPEFIEFFSRDQLSALLAEKGQQDIGVIDSSSVATAGELASVHAFVFGDILMVNEHFPRDQVSGPQQNAIDWKDYNTGITKKLYATFRHHTRQGSVEVTASFSIVEGQTGAFLNADQIQDRREDLARWITFSGDERAVPAWAKKAQTQGGQRPIETPQNMVLAAIDEISTKLAKRLVSTFE